MASTVFELTVRVMVCALTIAIATLPACADELPNNAVTTSRIGKAKSIVNTTVTPSAYDESTIATYSKYAVEVRNHVAVKRLSDDMETVTSEPTSTAAHCSFEETASVDLGALLDAGEGALVTLVAGEALLTAHRAVLTARSPAFTTMLCHGSQGASSSQVHVSDVEVPVLRQLLAYLYTLQAPQLPGMAPQLLAAADKFGLSDLKSHCEAQVAAQLDVETAVATAVLAIRHSSTNLRQAAILFIRAHTYQVMATQGLADAVLHQPHDVIKVFRLLSETPVETSPQNASLGSTPAAADSQPTTEAQSSQGQTLATTASPASPCPTLAPGDEAVSRLRSLSSEEKGRRLIKAAEEGTVGEVEALLAVGADVGARDGYRWTALHWSSYKGHVDVARLLLGCGAEVDARDSLQRTPLHEATNSGHTAVVRLLLAASADPNARTHSGWTPLHSAAWNGYSETAAALLEAGAKRGAKNKEGSTPLHYARKNNNQQVIALLKRGGQRKEVGAAKLLRF